MSLILVGINHKTAEISLREKVAFPPEIIRDALREVRKLDSVDEVVLLSTCNRTELYINGIQTTSSDEDNNEQLRDLLVQQRVEEVVEWLANFHNLQLANLMNLLFHERLSYFS